MAMHHSRVSAPMALRLHAPAAGTAVVFSIYAGLKDAQNIYGMLLQGQQNAKIQ
jgi:hypothetical protein